MNKEYDSETIRLIREEESLSIESRDAFIALTETQDVFYRYGEGYKIRAYIETEDQFIDFVQKAGLIDLWGMVVPFFVNDSTEFDLWFEYKETVKTSDFDTAEFFSFEDEEENEINRTFFPTVKKNALTCTYNEFFEKPYRIRKEEVLVYDQDDIRVKDDVKRKFPCVVEFVSEDTFDRHGTVKGHSLSIIELKELTLKAVLA